MIQISNGIIEASFLAKGAELKSLLTLQCEKEWIWEADPAFWGKTSPILFPIVGGLKDDTYQFNGQNFQLPRHGFARDMEFEVRKHQRDQVVFGLASSKKTRRVYPFDFDLEIEYRLEGNAFLVQYRVKNISEQNQLWFSLGAHPAFSIEVNEMKSFSDYMLNFEEDNELHPHPLHDNLLKRKRNNIALQNHGLPLTYSLFENDALVLTDLESQQIILSNSKDNEKLIFSFSNFPYFGIWSAKNANFVCLEPWAGIADFEDHNGELTEKAGINSLLPNDEWKAEWKVELLA
jgi:galactose mutarotase-like enzyme